MTSYALPATLTLAVDRPLAASNPPPGRQLPRTLVSSSVAHCGTEPSLPLAAISSPLALATCVGPEVGSGSQGWASEGATAARTS